MQNRSPPALHDFVLQDLFLKPFLLCLIYTTMSTFILYWSPTLKGQGPRHSGISWPGIGWQGFDGGIRRSDTEEDRKQVEGGHGESEEFHKRLQLQPGHHGGPESGEKGVNLPCLFAFVLKRGLLISTKAFSSAQKEPVSHPAIKYQINTESTWSLFTSFHVISLPIPCI